MKPVKFSSEVISGKAIFTNPEGSQSGRVLFLLIRKAGNLANPEGSILPIWRVPIFVNPMGSQFCQSGGVQFCQSGRFPILPIRKGLFCQSGGVPILLIQRGPILAIRKSPNFANSERSYFCQSGGSQFLPIQKGPIFTIPKITAFKFCLFSAAPNRESSFF